MPSLAWFESALAWTAKIAHENDPDDSRWFFAGDLNWKKTYSSGIPPDTVLLKDMPTTLLGTAPTRALSHGFKAVLWMVVPEEGRAHAGPRYFRTSIVVAMVVVGRSPPAGGSAA